jgi:hypothetical protein
MKAVTPSGLIVALLGALSGPAQAQSELVLDRVLQPGTTEHFEHQDSVVLTNGFWAKSGSDVSFSIEAPTGFFIDKTPLDPTDRQYTDTEGRTFIVAGCVPKNLPMRGISGSVWVACNDLDLMKDKVVESEFVSCLDIYPNGVLQGFFVREVNNRTWQSFRFSCRDLKSNGSVGSQWKKARFLFNFEKEGKLYETTVPTSHLSVGMFEVWNQLQFRQSLLTIALDHQTAPVILDAGQRNRRLTDFLVSEKVPPSAPSLINFTNWLCPPGMVITGAAIGHVPKKKDTRTRPVYLLAECRTLHHG